MQVVGEWHGRMGGGAEGSGVLGFGLAQASRVSVEKVLERRAVKTML